LQQEKENIKRKRLGKKDDRKTKKNEREYDGEKPFTYTLNA
jgi:hypothetical protein